MGSLFWRWDVQVYAGSGVADYGVRQFDSTFGAQVTLCEWIFPVSTYAGHILLDCRSLHCRLPIGQVQPTALVLTGSTASAGHMLTRASQLPLSPRSCN